MLTHWTKNMKSEDKENDKFSGDRIIVHCACSLERPNPGLLGFEFDEDNTKHNLQHFISGYLL